MNNLVLYLGGSPSRAPNLSSLLLLGPPFCWLCSPKFCSMLEEDTRTQNSAPREGLPGSAGLCARRRDCFFFFFFPVE